MSRTARAARLTTLGLLATLCGSSACTGPDVGAAPYMGPDASLPYSADASMSRDAASRGDSSRQSADAAQAESDAARGDAGDGPGQIPSDVQAIFDKACAGGACHVGSAAPALGLDLSAGQAFSSLVGVASEEAVGRLRVTPGDPEASFLICKLTPDCTDLVGGSMPPGGQLGADELQWVRDWINSLTDAVDTSAPSFSGIETARSSSEGTVDLTWSPASDDETLADELVYRIFVAEAPKSQDFAAPFASVRGATSHNIRGLVPGNTYYFAVRAADVAGNVDANTAERAATVQDATPPIFSGVQSATATSGSSVRLSWTVATDNGEDSAVRYRVYAATASGAQDFDTPLLETTSAGNEALVSGLQDTTTYYFVVRAVDRAGNEETNTTQQSATTLDATPPSFAGASSAVGGANSIELGWSAANDAVTASADIVYLVYQSGVPGAQNYSSPTLTTPSGATSVSVSGLAPSTAYFFVVRAQDAEGNVDANTIEVSATTSATSDAVAPTFAGVSGASASSETAITLSWTPASDDVSTSDHISYLIYRATSSDSFDYQTPTYTTNPGVSSYLCTGLSTDTTYYFVVRARDQAGNVSTNTEQTSETTLGDSAPPSFAGLSSASALSSSSISLTWSAATDNASASASLVYLVYQATSAGSQSFTAPTYTTAPGVTSMTVTGLTADTSYYFVVRARDESGNIDGNTQEQNATTSSESPSFSAVIQPIFSTHCASMACHGGIRSPNLSSAVNSYANLVNVPSEQCGSTMRVAPSDPESSYLIWKLRGSGACFSGGQMPGGGAAPLDTATQNQIRAWISAGALNN